MKTIVLLSAFLLIITDINAQKLEISVNARGGGTIVDVAEAMGYVMEDWNTWCYGGYIQGLYSPNNYVSFGIDLGYQQLYYYEYRNYYGYYNWGNIGTFHVGPVLKLEAFNLYGEGGVHLHIFYNGVVPGIMLAGGYKIPVSDRLSIPLGLRGDVIFGSATPIAATLILGLSYKI